MKLSLRMLGLLAGATIMGWAQATPVFVNEIHYDNTGTDAGEAIEIAGPAGTNLAGWSLVLYNGSGGTSYDTAALTGTIPNQQNGFGTVVFNFPVNGIQNGSPDGIALVNGSAVVQFLSYEGSFTAVGGPANGLTSTDIGVSESGTTLVGHALRLAGTGSQYEDFGWQSPAAGTFGAVNTSQMFSTSFASLVINEIDYDQAGTDTAEFVELFNRGTTPVDLSSFVVELVNGTGGGAAVYRTISLPGIVLGAGRYFVICANSATVVNCDLDGTPNTDFIQNGPPDAAGLRLTSGALVDAVSYEGDSGAPYTEGSGAGLVDDPSFSFYGLSRFPNGVDTNGNNSDISGRCITPGYVNSSSASDCLPPSVIVNVPGPDTLALLGLGLAGLGVSRRKRAS